MAQIRLFEKFFHTMSFLQIQSYGMKVYAYTFKTEPSSFCWEHAGDYRNELDRFFGLGLDGYFSDFPNTVRSFLDDYSEKSNGSVKFLSLALRLMPAFLITIQTMLIFWYFMHYCPNLQEKGLQNPHSVSKLE